MDSLRIAKWKLQSAENLLQKSINDNSELLKHHEEIYKKHLHNYKVIIAYNKAYSELIRLECLVLSGTSTKSPFLKLYKKRLREQAQILVEIGNLFNPI